MLNTKVKKQIEVIANEHGFTYSQVIGRDRSRPLDDVRSMVVRILRDDWRMSYQSIGDALGGRSHVTIMSFLKKKQHKPFAPR